jgi:hypothetical protein
MLRANYRRNEIKIGYQIKCCRFGFWKIMLTGIQFMFEVKLRDHEEHIQKVWKSDLKEKLICNN